MKRRVKSKVAKRLVAVRKYGLRIRHHRPGAPPGTLEPRSPEAAEEARPAVLRRMCYGRQGLRKEERELEVAECKPPAPGAQDDVMWLHLQGSPTSEQLKTLGENFDLHPLALEDIFNQEGRAKLETFDRQQFVVLNHVHRDEDGNYASGQISFFLGRGYLISINQGASDVFQPVRQRIQTRGKICARGADYLLYSLMDVIVDSGFPLLEELGEELESLEDDILDNPDRDSRNRLHYAKRELIQMRRAWWPQREVIASLMRNDDDFLSEKTQLYMRDCYDHCVIVMDFVETYRETASSLLDVYLSAVSQRMNDIMKTLAIIATVFLPLTTLAGIYGMNFEGGPWNMPELHWRYGYFYALGVMLAIVIGMLVWFKRKRWI